MDWIEASRDMSQAGAGAVSGFLYDHYEKTKEAEYQKGYQAGQQSAKKSQ